MPVEGRGEARVLTLCSASDVPAEPLSLIVIGDGSDHPGIVAICRIAAVGSSSLVLAAARAMDEAVHRVAQIDVS